MILTFFYDFGCFSWFEWFNIAKRFTTENRLLFWFTLLQDTGKSLKRHTRFQCRWLVLINVTVTGSCLPLNCNYLWTFERKVVVNLKFKSKGQQEPHLLVMKHQSTNQNYPFCTYLMPMCALCWKSFRGVDIVNFLRSLSSSLSPCLKMAIFEKYSSNTLSLSMGD